MPGHTHTDTQAHAHAHAPSPRLAILVHGGPGSVEAIRARELSASFPRDHILILHRDGARGRVATTWRRQITAFRPDLIYILNTALPGALLGPWLRQTRGIPYILDTGDVIHQMARDSGVEPAWRLPLLRAAETLAQRRAAAIVVRGSRHRQHLASLGYPNLELIRDGFVDPGPVHPAAVDALRQRLGLRPDRLIVGVLGSTVYSPRLRICYGWDLIGAIARLRDLPIDGLVIGDGNGLPWLRDQAAAAGVTDRITFAGRIPYADVQPALRLMDIAISTQTNNLAGQVRTTGKLPEYMAAGRFILASRVGDAALLLPDPMLVEFEGTVDRAYPEKLAARIRQLHQRPGLLSIAESLPGIAREHCSYPVLRKAFVSLVHQVVARHSASSPPPPAPRAPHFL